MRCLIALALVASTPVRLHCQWPDAGATVRVTTATDTVIGTLVGADSAGISVRAGGGPRNVPLGELRGLAVRRHFDTRAARRTGLGLGALVIIVAVLGDTSYSAGTIAVGAVATAGFGYLMGGAGRRGVRLATTGAVIGAIPAAIIAAAATRECSPSEWICFGPEFALLAGAVVGATAGFVLGGVSAALTAEGWDGVRLPARASVRVSPGRSGMRIGLSVPMRL